MRKKINFDEENLEFWCIENNRHELLSEWCYEKNLNDFNITPQNVTKGSPKKAYWRCDKNHIYVAAIDIKTSQSTGCPYCKNHKLLKGFNDFKTSCINNNLQHLITEWDYEKNDKDPSDYIGLKSNETVSWVCKLGHSYSAKICSRTGKSHTGCPYCAGKKILEGFNDFASVHPHLLLDWDYESNNSIGIFPNSIGASVDVKVSWICHICKYKWDTVINNRTNNHHQNGCPNCAKQLQTSFSEQAIYYYVKQIFPDAINGDRNILDGKELDIYIPSQKVAIEYDGCVWHSNKKEHDLKKEKLCQEKGITLYRIKEYRKGGITLPNSEFIYYHCKDDYNMLSSIINDIFRSLKVKKLPLIDINKDILIIKKTYYSSKEEKSLSIKYPKIAKEWHPTKNGEITPLMVSASTDDKYWWMCSKCKYEWYARVSSRTCSNTGCIVCASKKFGQYNKRSVQNVDTGQIYESLSDAVRKTNIKNIAKCCLGERKTAGGYHWKYID